MEPVDPVPEALWAKIEDAIMKRTAESTPSPCEHSTQPEWENTLWLAAVGDLPWEEEERLIAEVSGCAYCRQQLARCMRAEMRAARLAPALPPVKATVPAEGAANRCFRLAVERLAQGFRCLEQGWTSLQPAAAALRGPGMPADALYVSRELLHFRVEACLSPAPDGRVQVGIAFHDRESGAAIDGHAELKGADGEMLESIPVQRGRGRFRAVGPGEYWIVLADSFGLSEILEVVVQ